MKKKKVDVISVSHNLICDSLLLESMTVPSKDEK